MRLGWQATRSFEDVSELFGLFICTKDLPEEGVVFEKCRSYNYDEGLSRYDSVEFVDCNSGAVDSFGLGPTYVDVFRPYVRLSRKREVVRFLAYLAKEGGLRV